MYFLCMFIVHRYLRQLWTDIDHSFFLLEIKAVLTPHHNNKYKLVTPLFLFPGSKWAPERRHNNSLHAYLCGFCGTHSISQSAAEPEEYTDYSNQIRGKMIQGKWMSHFVGFFYICLILAKEITNILTSTHNIYALVQLSSK